MLARLKRGSRIYGEIALAQSPFFEPGELKDIGFHEVGANVQISRKCSFYRISGRMGDHVRIDDFCIFKGHVELGSYIHIAAYCSVSGAHARVAIHDFSTLSNRVSIFTGSDNYAADTLNNSLVPEELTAIKKGPVIIGQAVLIGAHSVILPEVEIGDAASIGAMAVVAHSVPAGGVVRSPPTIVHSERKRDVEKIRSMAKDFLARSGKKR
jgi:acetyltransferase-like isoleucine patch superfamily enzyme